MDSEKKPAFLDQDSAAIKDVLTIPDVCSGMPEIIYFF